MAVDLKKTAQSVIASILSSVNPVAGAAAKAYIASPAHIGSAGTKDFGVTEKVWGRDNPNVGTSRSASILGLSDTAGSSSNFNKAYQAQPYYSDPNSPKLSNISAYSGGDGGGGGDVPSGGDGGISEEELQRQRYEATINRIRRILAERQLIAQDWLGRAKKSRVDRGAGIEQDYAKNEAGVSQNRQDVEKSNRISARAMNLFGSSGYENALYGNRNLEEKNLGTLLEGKQRDIASADEALASAEDQAKQLELSNVEDYAFREDEAANNYDSKIAQIQAANKLLQQNGINAPTTKGYAGLNLPTTTVSSGIEGNPVSPTAILEQLRQRGLLSGYMG